MKDAVKYAVKYMLKSHDLYKNKTCLDLTLNEAKIMQQLDHPNIVKLYEFGDDGVIRKENGTERPVLYLVFELVTGGELFDYVAIGGRFPDPIARFYFKSLIQALDHLYSKGYAHRDIKAENILLDEKANLKLADFGFATLAQGKDGSGKLITQKGTMGYMAPEINMGKPYEGEKADLFAVGVLLFIMVAQHPPFRRAVPLDPFYKLLCQQNSMFWTKMQAGKPPGTFSDALKSLINSLLSFNPELRPTLSSLKEHPWFKDFTPTLEEVQSEFARRRSQVEHEWKVKAQEAIIKKRTQKATEEKKKAAFGGYGAHVATKAVMAEEKKASSAIKRVLRDYCAEVHDQTILYSVEEPDEIFEKLCECLESQQFKVESEEKSYKIKATFTDVEMGNSILEFRIERAEEEVQAITCQRQEGSKMEYLRLFNILKEKLYDYEMILQLPTT
eukprot:TRINITY_DN3029_c0_g1_i4.p1 TRINITY_DN3029_c0_g1~~TRINITY_DN3029_c0_g1_i4.p1  ORF type:complete len:445 (+),score=96.02 TRINITY_DN3029_c0_g1_i4:256-1590(+)